MAKHHGMKFLSSRGSEMYYDGGSDFRITKECGVYGGEYYYIHPDSVALLTAIEGDLVSFEWTSLMYKTPAWVTSVLDDGILTVCGPEGPDGIYICNGEYKIIQRNGLPFFQPESEGA